MPPKPGWRITSKVGGCGALPPEPLPCICPRQNVSVDCHLGRATRSTHFAAYFSAAHIGAEDCEGEHNYRAYLVSTDGHIVFRVDLDCNDDETAKGKAKALRRSKLSGRALLSAILCPLQFQSTEVSYGSVKKRHSRKSGACPFYPR
jgi:hypothetical protein